MNPEPDYVKSCARCQQPVRLTREQYALERDQAQTTCPRCRARLNVEAAAVLERAAPPLPKDEASQPQPARSRGQNPT